MSIYVGNLSYTAKEEDLEAAFAEYGKVKRITLPTDRESGRPRGFAFVEMEEDSSEDKSHRSFGRRRVDGPRAAG